MHCFDDNALSFGHAWPKRGYMRVIDFGRPVGASHPPFIIAALDCRELGTLERALRAVDVAADSKVDAIKLGRMPSGWGPQLFARAEKRNLMMLATVLDEEQVARLDWMGAPAFYLVFDWSDLELVARAAATGKPLVMQVGTASEVELAEVVATAHAHGKGGIALVQSVIDVELEGLAALRRHSAVVGIADRSRGNEIPRAAISNGVPIIEKRFALRGNDDLCPKEVGEVVRDCEQLWASITDDRRWAFN
jgi:N-acetylneuraminate synthase